MTLIHLKTHHWDEHGRLYRPGEHDVPPELAARWGFVEPTPEPIESSGTPESLPSIRALPAALSEMTDDAVREMMARDARSSAAPIYRARLGE